MSDEKKKITPNENEDKSKKALKMTGKILFKTFSYIVNFLFSLILIGLICTVIVGTVFAIYIKTDLDIDVDPAILVSAEKDTTTRVYYMKYDSEEDRQIRNGTPIELEDERLYGSINSLWADYEEMPKDLINAFIAIEDHRFMSHNGVDWLGTSKAFVNYFVGFEDVRGASTITQQLIKNLTGDDEVKIQRKVEEIFRALSLEKMMSKEEILEMYLNVVYLGNNCYGVQTAANTYFGKDVSELTLTECASLAAIVKNPSRYEPLYHDEFTFIDDNGEEKIDGNKDRRGTVLYTMRMYGYISDEQYNSALNEDLHLTYFDEDDEDTSSAKGYTVHSWYVDSAIMQIIDDLMKKYDWTYAVASAKLYSSGYNIYIPMDPEIQGIMEEVYYNDEEYIPKAQEGLQPESAMVITDPSTGDVLGVIGGRGEKSANLILNRATRAVRPVGSSIKPLSVYGPSLDAGIITPTTIIEDSPVMTRKVVHGEGTAWEWTEEVEYPHNLPDIYSGDITITDGVTRSVNTVAMKVLQMLTVEKSFDFMKNTLHFDSLIESKELADGSIITDKGLAALSLGQLNYGFTVMEMAGGYSMLANNGLYESPNLYLEVTDSAGQVVLENTHYTEAAIKEKTAQTMTAILMNVMNAGTGTSVTLRHSLNVAGKTGTTNADYDRYFVGYTPYCIGAVWVGYDINSSLSAYGVNPACSIWDIVMTKVHEKYILADQAGTTPLKTFDISQADPLFGEPEKANP